MTRFVPAIQMLALATFALWVSGCADLRERVQSASDNLDAFVVEKGIVPPDADAHYRDGLARRQEGADAEAAEHFRQAAEAGHPAAAYELASAYDEGRGLEQNKNKAAEWYSTAAQRGEPRAQYLMGAAYYSGLGVERNYELAVTFLGEAAVQGHARAQYLLAEAFANGNGVEKDLAWAARWYGKAARQGHTQAQFAYGVLYTTGGGLQHNERSGLMWFTIAAAGGHEQAKVLRLALRERLDSEAVAWAEAKATAFRPTANTVFADPPTVMYVQQRLNELGYDIGSVDGSMGPRTRTGISAYQQARGQVVDGEVTAELLTRILQEPPS
jgi:TPR repeat protein